MAKRKPRTLRRRNLLDEPHLYSPPEKSEKAAERYLKPAPEVPRSKGWMPDRGCGEIVDKTLSCLPAIGRARIRLWDPYWVLLADVLGECAEVNEWLRQNALAGQWATIDYHGNRDVGRIVRDGVFEMYDFRMILAPVEWWDNPGLAS